MAADAPPYPSAPRYRTLKDVDSAAAALKRYQLRVIQHPYAIKNMPELKGDAMRFLRPELFGESLKVGPMLIECRHSDYMDMNWISDFFNQDARIKCKRYDEPQSPAEYWAEHWREIQAQHPGDLRAQEDLVYSKVAGCGTFRPSLLIGFAKKVAKWLNKSLPNLRILDFSAGWGCRKIAAMLLGAYYFAADPNPDVHVGYELINQHFCKKQIKVKPGENPAPEFDQCKILKSEVVQAPFQEVELPNEVLFDLVFTSPPYWNLEDYGDAPGQSTREFQDLDSWFEGFLMTSMLKSWAVLAPGGYMVVIINDIRGHPPYVARMIEEFTRRSEGRYLGLVSYAEVKKVGPKLHIRSPQPMWVWVRESP